MNEPPFEANSEDPQPDGASRRITREELYERVWSQPMVKVAKDFGISDRGLAKTCKRLEVPVPPRGYWAKLQAGKRVSKIPLPVPKSKLPPEISIQRTPVATESPVPEQVRAEVNAVIEKRDRIRVPETLSSPHPIIEKWLQQKRERHTANRLSGSRGTDPRMDSTERRRLRILSTIFKEVEKLGHGVKETPEGQVYLEFESQKIEFKLSQRYQQVQVPLTEEEKRWSWRENATTRTDLQPTGELCFEITTWISEPIRKRWRDGKRHTLEEQLGDLIAGLIYAAAIRKEWERQRAEEEARRLERERIRAEQERLRRIDAARWRHLTELAACARQANMVREFLDGLEQRARSAAGDQQLSADLQSWFSWARKRADTADPALAAPIVLVNENLSLDEYSYRN
jgi:hypothetical protein